ncbi:hypothetical protein [Xanthobacter sp. ZOL 2024]
MERTPNQGWRWTRPSFRLPLLIAAAVGAATLMTSAVLMWQGWQAARAALFSSAQETSIYMGRLIDEKAQGLLASAPPSRLITSPTTRWSPPPPSTSACSASPPSPTRSRRSPS